MSAAAPGDSTDPQSVVWFRNKPHNRLVSANKHNLVNDLRYQLLPTKDVSRKRGQG